VKTPKLPGKTTHFAKIARKRISFANGKNEIMWFGVRMPIGLFAEGLAAWHCHCICRK